ncbi:MAG: MupG family TIM beta-alpha barrel fold protein [Erysipelotrichaceae bacterium]|nr:MupG family TIM beta-alpha barrel fold protein [Erysipelotrichaceae bacterium]MDY5252775.1 MupG family TIM beta-alpha barrel fold protein [Erysipelotrichaceae bacterium]
MHKLGISIYPEHSTFEKDCAYMELAAKYGFKRIFTCLLSVDKPKEYILEEFGRFMDKAHELGFEVSVDTAPYVFEHLGATPSDISVFHELKVDIIRLDGHFDDYLDKLITHNPYGIKIEFNGSSDANVDGLIKHGADVHNMIICHNFYPEKYSGLGWNTFVNFNKKWKSLGMHTAAFVSSNAKDTFGPWPVYEGLPTLEMHRGLPIDVQVRHLLACETIDDILIGNAFATEEELKAMAQIDLTKTTIGIELCDDVTEEEKHILFEIDHAGRTDHSDYYIRSSIPRTEYRKKSVPFRSASPAKFTRGDVVIVNDNLGHYRGECEIILQDIENDGQRNLVGRIPANEMIILDRMEEHPDHIFGFVKK